VAETNLSGNSLLLRATGLRRSFGARVVLAGLDLSLAEGETLAVVGPNGAGKTTLLRILAGLLRPGAGEIQLDGRAVRPGEPESRASIGLLSHRAMLYDDLTLQENLEFAARLHGLPDPAGAASAALAQVSLEGRAHDSPRTLSRGLLQRAALCRALLHRPRLLLLDEPFTGLDVQASERLRTLLAARRPAGLGTIVVTHQVSEVWDLASRVVALADGRWLLEEAADRDLDRFMARYRAALPA
jgi:heme exporter protein A